MWGMFRMEFEHVHVGSSGGVVSLHLENKDNSLAASHDGNDDLKVAIFHIIMGFIALILAMIISAGIIMGIIYS